MSNGLLDGAGDSSGRSRLNLLAVLAQAGMALRNGNHRDAAVLLGAATLASQHRGLSYLLQGGVTLNDLRRRFT